jgi:hypothetical protein
MTPAGSAPIVLLMLVGLVLTFGSPVAWFLFRTDDDAAYKEYKSARLEQDVVSMIKDSYEQRYQSELERK